MKLKLMALVVSIAVASGCANVGNEPENSKTKKTAQGAAIGAAAGAAIGAMTSNKSGRGKGVATGAAIGGLLGAGTGYAVADRQEKAMRERMEKTGVQVDRQGDVLNLRIPGNISFASGSAALQPSFYSVLDSVALTLSEYPETQIQIVGHTDSVGSGDANQRLSRDRATAVSLYLGGKGIAPARMQAEGMGASMPIAANSIAEGRAQNRRVEMRIIPIAKPVAAK